jgi:hypothetical protein
MMFSRKFLGSQYLRCARSYRYRYLDGWREKDTRAAMVFGRCFETAVAAYFCGQDCTAVLFKGWDIYRELPLEYGKGDSWDKLFHQGIHLLHKFAQDDRVRIRRPQKNLQLKATCALANGNEFIAYILPRISGELRVVGPCDTAKTSFIHGDVVGGKVQTRDSPYARRR